MLYCENNVTITDVNWNFQVLMLKIVEANCITFIYWLSMQIVYDIYNVSKLCYSCNLFKWIFSFEMEFLGIIFMPVHFNCIYFHLRQCWLNDVQKDVCCHLLFFFYVLHDNVPIHALICSWWAKVSVFISQHT